MLDEKRNVIVEHCQIELKGEGVVEEKNTLFLPESDLHVVDKAPIHATFTLLSFAALSSGTPDRKAEKFKVLVSFSFLFSFFPFLFFFFFLQFISSRKAEEPTFFVADGNVELNRANSISGEAQFSGKVSLFVKNLNAWEPVQLQV